MPFDLIRSHTLEHPTEHRSRPANCGLAGSSSGGTVEVVSLLDRITVDPQVCHGAPTVRGLRYPVEMIVGLLASGMTTDEILSDYPDLVADDVLASLEYAALVTRTHSSVPITAA